MKPPPPLQRNLDRFAESNECLLALLGCVSFGARLDDILRTARPTEQPARYDEVLYLLLGAIAVREAIRRGLDTLASGSLEQPEAEPDDRMSPSLRELLR